MSRIATKSWCNTLAKSSIFDPNNNISQCPTKKQIDNVGKLMVKTTGTIWDSWASLVSGYTDNRLVRRDDIGHKVNCTYYKGVSGGCNIYFCQNGFTETNGLVPESAKTLSITPFTGSSDNTNHTTLLGFSNDFFSKMGGSEWQNARIVADMSSSTSDVMQYIINDIPGSKSSNGSYFSWTNAETLQILSRLNQNILNIYVSDKSTSYTLTSDVSAGDLEMLNGASRLIKFTYNTYETNASGETVLVDSITVSPTWTTSDSSLATASGDSITANSNDKQGLVTITATYAGISLSWNIQVYKYKFSLSLDKSSLSIFVDNTASLKALYNKHKVTQTGTDGDIIDTTIITSSCDWSSSNTSIATVSAGTVTGIAAGSATITASYVNGSNTHTATSTVTVKNQTTSLHIVYTASDFSTDDRLQLTCYSEIRNKVTGNLTVICQDTNITATYSEENTEQLGVVNNLTADYIKNCEISFYGDWISGYGIMEVYLKHSNGRRTPIYQSLDLNGDSWMNRPNSPSIVADLSNYQFGDTIELWINGDGSGANLNPVPDARYTITGKITDKYLGDPIIACNVTIEGYGAQYGTVSDVEGNYRLDNIPGALLADGSLVFSYVGYDSQTIKINGRTKIDVQLIDSGFKLLQSIELNKVSYTSYNGNTSPVNVYATYDDDSTADVTSLCTVTITDQSVTGVATWNSSGFYIQHGSTGTAKINVSYTENDVTKTFSAPITTRPIQPKSIVFDPSTITVNVGESKTVYVYGLLENGVSTTSGLTFEYINGGYNYINYTVESTTNVNGKSVIPLKITGKAEGSSNIGCSFTQGGLTITSQLVVIVNNITNVDITVLPTNITLGSHNNTLLNSGYNSVQLNAYLSDGSKIPNDLITWESNNSSQINVNSNGLVTPNSTGLLNDTATITATYDTTGYTTPIEHGVGTSEVSVMRSTLYAAKIQSTDEFSPQSSPGSSPTSRYEIIGSTFKGIQLYRFITEFEIGTDSIQLATEITSNVTNETWTSSNPDIVSVTNDGVINAALVRADTEVTITYTCTSEFGGDLTGYFYILAKPLTLPDLTLLTFDPISITLTMGLGTISPFKLMYGDSDVTYEDGVEFTSSDTSIATVTYTNLGGVKMLSVIGVAEGTCRIIGKYNGYTAFCSVRVEDKSVTPPTEDEYIAAKRFDVRTKCNNIAGVLITVDGSVEYYIGNDGIGPLANTNGIQCSFLPSTTPYADSTGYICATSEIPSIPTNKWNDLWIKIHITNLIAAQAAYGTQITGTKYYDFDLISGGGATTNTGFTEEYDCDNHSTTNNGMQEYDTGWIRVSDVVSKGTYMEERFGILVSLDILS